ncbi:MAG: TerC family protein [Janthinobacterium lividum]
MSELLANMHWGAILQIVVIDILLGGDNAIVIALACRDLPPSQRMKGIVWGTAGAIGLRLVLVGFAVYLLDLPVLKLAGGLLLVWIGVRLMRPQHDKHAEIKPSARLLAAIKTIIVADFVMSLDNVIAIAGAAEAAPASTRIFLVAFGLIISIPIIVWGSQLILKALDRFPFIIYFGAALLGWIAGGLIVDDPLLQPYPALQGDAFQLAASIVGALFVVLLGGLLRMRGRASSA